MNAQHDSEGMLWRLTPGQALRRRGWDGEHLVYNDLSGDTHLLTEPAIRLLLALQQQSRPQAALAALAGLSGVQADEPGMADAVDALLADLESLSLIECSAC